MALILEKLSVRLREFERRTVRFFGGLSLRDAEYDFAYRQITGERQRVLDVGGTTSLLPLQLARLGHCITVYDYREYHERHRNIVSICGDFLDNDFADASFDCVLMVSTIEHIGFGSYGAPVYDDGDFRAMDEAKRVVKPDGKIILTFPFASRERQISGFERWYDINRVRQLFKGLTVLAEEYYVPYRRFLGRFVKWLPASLEQIDSVDDVTATFGYQCNACYAVSPTPTRHFAE
jgi:SAM-dependent methyltransferase